MPFHNYYCKNCDKEFSLLISAAETNIKGYVNFDKGYEVSYLVSSLTPEQAKKLPDHERPEDYDKWKVVRYKDIPENPKCPECFKSKTSKLITNFSGYVKGNCFTNRERERKFYEKGLDKQQANTFYNESIEASKERIKSGGVHYKKVDFDMEFFAKKGLAKKTDNMTKKIDNLKKYNAELVKIADSKKKKK
jgi:hypothetical protein